MIFLGWFLIGVIVALINSGIRKEVGYDNETVHQAFLFDILFWPISVIEWFNGRV